MNKYPEKITKEDIQKIKTWFQNTPLPQTMQINASAYTPDLPATVNYLIIELEANHHNPNMHGSYRLLYEIKQKIQTK